MTSSNKHGMYNNQHFQKLPNICDNIQTDVWATVATYSSRTLKPMGGRPGLPGNAIKSAAATTVTANGGLWTWGGLMV